MRKNMLYIMRHGVTEWNALKKLQGRTDIPLNDEGRAMAVRAAKEYRDVHLDLCFSSPLSRAYETARLMLEGRNVPIITDRRLEEMSFGQYEGMVNYFGDADSPIHALFRDPGSYRESVGGAETFDELFARTGEFLRERVAPELERGRDVLIVGHGAMNASIVCRIRGIPVERFWSAGLEQCRLVKLCDTLPEKV